MAVAPSGNGAVSLPTQGDAAKQRDLPVGKATGKKLSRTGGPQSLAPAAGKSLSLDIPVSGGAVVRSKGRTRDRQGSDDEGDGDVDDGRAQRHRRPAGPRNVPDVPAGVRV